MTLFGLVAALAALVAEPASAAMAIPVDTPVSLTTIDTLSSKTSVKGDPVRLRTDRDVVVGAQVVIPAGTEVVGQIADARAKGAMGMSGRISVRPLYLRVGSAIVRLTGQASDRASVAPGAVIGMVALGAAAFSGRSAVIPAGTRLTAYVEKRAVIAP